MTWQIIRSVQQFQVGAQTNTQVLRSPSGPRGQPAGQDIGWMASNSLQAGEVLTSAPLGHPATYVEIYAHSESGFQSNQTLTVNQKRAGAIVATASLSVGPGANDWSTAITALVGLVGDVFQLVLPNPADGQCSDISGTLGSTP